MQQAKYEKVMLAKFATKIVFPYEKILLQFSSLCSYLMYTSFNVDYYIFVPFGKEVKLMNALRLLRF